MNRVAVCGVGVRQREGGAEESAKACWTVEVDLWLCVGGPIQCEEFVRDTERYLRECHAKKSLLDEGSQGCCVKEWVGP